MSTTVRSSIAMRAKVRAVMPRIIHPLPCGSRCGDSARFPHQSSSRQDLNLLGSQLLSVACCSQYRAVRRLRRHRSDPRRDRHRQGARRAGDPRRERARQRPFVADQLRRDSRRAARERAVRPRARRVHRRRAARTGAGRSRPTAAPCSSTSSSELPPSQLALLRFLQDRGPSARRRRARDADVRVIAARRRGSRRTGRRAGASARPALPAQRAVGAVPPLRARGDDVIVLARAPPSPRATARRRRLRRRDRRASAHTRPGNVRELENLFIASSS